ncbi:SpoIIE family protein phosphatase [Actinospica acidithermotolerans]
MARNGLRRSTAEGTPSASGGLSPAQDAIEDVLADVVRRTGASMGGIYLFEPGDRMLRMTALCGLPVEFATPWRRVPLSEALPVADAVRQGRLVWIGSQEEMARDYPRVAAVLPYRLALAAVALEGANRCWGALLLLWSGAHPRQARRRERGHITSSGRRIGRLLDHVGTGTLPEEPQVVALARARRHVGNQTAIADFAERLPGAAALDLEGRFTYVSAHAARFLGREAEVLLGTRPWHSLPWLDDPAYEDHYRTAVVSREPVTYSAVRPPDCHLTFQLHPDTSGISVLISPADGPGALDALPRPASRPEAAPTGRLYQLVHLAAALTETVGAQDVVDLVADQVLPAFRAQGLVLSGADAGRLKIVGHHGYPAEIIERLDHLPLDTDLTPAGRALSTGCPCFLRDREELSRGYPRAPSLTDKQAWAFLPLIVSGRPVGVCTLSYDEPHAFSADERAVLTSLAGLLAQALERARLYDAAHAVARDLQQALLPRTLPSLPGLDVAARYLPASHGLDVGGDFYDVIKLTEHTAAAVIGDVQGHSIAAAALMGQARTAVHAHATAGAAPDQVLARTSRVIADLEPDLLVSCLYVHLDFARGRAMVSSAGHPAPLLRRPGERADPVPVEPGPLLGVDPDSTYPTTTFDVPPGSLLTLYTDGLIEAPGTDPDDAVAALADVLTDVGPRAPDHLDHVIDALLRHAQRGAQHTDDIAVLLVHCLPGSPNPAHILSDNSGP